MRSITSIIIHCTASDNPKHDNLESIYKWHVEERNFTDVGYHYVILKNGRLEHGRPIIKPGAHARGYNSYSVGVAFSGLNEFTKEQHETCVKLCRNLVDIFGIEDKNIIGHNQVSHNKTCPNFDVKSIKEDIWKK